MAWYKWARLAPIIFQHYHLDLISMESLESYGSIESMELATQDTTHQVPALFRFHGYQH